MKKIYLTQTEINFLINVLNYLKTNAKQDENKIKATSLLEKIENIGQIKEKNEFGYLTGLSEKTITFFHEFLNAYKLNVYHSIAAIINNKPKSTIDELYDFYVKKYKIQRPLILNNLTELKELITFVKHKLHEN